MRTALMVVMRFLPADPAVADQSPGGTAVPSIHAGDSFRQVRVSQFSCGMQPGTVAGRARLMRPEATQAIEQAAAAIGTPARYDRLSILLHWITAVLVVILWTLGQTIDFFPKGAARIDARST